MNSLCGMDYDAPRSQAKSTHIYNVDNLEACLFTSLEDWKQGPSCCRHVRDGVMSWCARGRLEWTVLQADKDLRSTMMCLESTHNMNAPLLC